MPSRSDWSSHVGDAGDPAVLHDVDDLRDDPGLAALLWYGISVKTMLLLRAHLSSTWCLARTRTRRGRSCRPAGSRCRPMIDAAGREVGAGDELAELASRDDLGVVEDARGRGEAISRRLCGRHGSSPCRPRCRPNRCRAGSGSALGRTTGSVHPRLVVVRLEVDGLLVEIGHHLDVTPVHARLRVAHGRGRVAVDRTEVALPVDQAGSAARSPAPCARASGR